VHVRDVAQANRLALESEQTAGALTAYNVASGVPHTVGDLARELALAAGGPEPVVTGQYRLGDVRHVVASPERAHQELGFTARIAPQAGIAAFAHAPLRGAAVSGGLGGR